MGSAQPMEGRCGAKSRDGFCTQWPIPGNPTGRCRYHPGRPGVAGARAAGAIVMELQRWGLGDTTLDPGEVLLRLVSQSAWRAERYAAEIERVVAEHGTLAEALTADAYTVTEDGKSVKTGEYIRAMTQLEAQERDRCANMATKAIAAGLAERQVRIAERQGLEMAGVFRRVLDALGLTEDQRILVPALLAREVAALTGRTIEGATIEGT